MDRTNSIYSCKGNALINICYITTDHVVFEFRHPRSPRPLRTAMESHQSRLGPRPPSPDSRPTDTPSLCQWPSGLPTQTATTRVTEPVRSPVTVPAARQCGAGKRLAQAARQTTTARMVQLLLLKPGGLQGNLLLHPPPPHSVLPQGPPLACRLVLARWQGQQVPLMSPGLHQPQEDGQVGGLPHTPRPQGQHPLVLWHLQRQQPLVHCHLQWQQPLVHWHLPQRRRRRRPVRRLYRRYSRARTPATTNRAWCTARCARTRRCPATT